MSTFLSISPGSEILKSAYSIRLIGSEGRWSRAVAKSSGAKGPSVRKPSVKQRFPILPAEQFIPGVEALSERLLRPTNEFLDPSDLLTELPIPGFGQGAYERFQQTGPQKPWNETVATVPGFAPVHPVTGEEFIAAVAGEGDLDVSGGLTRDDIGGHGGGVAEGLVKGGQDVGNRFDDFPGIEKNFMVLRPVEGGDLPGVGRLVVHRHVFVADGVGLDRAGGLARHQADDDARIDAAAQEGPERNIGDHLALDRLLQGTKEGRLHPFKIPGIRHFG